MFMFIGRPVAPAEVGRVTEGGPAAQAGLRTGDRIVAVDGKPVQYWEELARVVQDRPGARSSSRCKDVTARSARSR